MKHFNENDEWLNHECETGEKCPIEGYWLQVETGNCYWHMTEDYFNPLTPAPNYQRARYKYIEKKSTLNN